ncbi:uncharacterized protein LOC116297807 [Actinia tenebrosa]|uniref:Uncharacterized protein LOC116297807 n=1 Tax=Actinia tenebrosa TaxID=6105 RepID=A0A6P8I2D7_ACTTE|nr:uncharacterized protein LOC116297807 [Actinia tenebrosa]
MVASGSHSSLESAPDVAFFDTTAEKKVSKNQPIEETVAAAIAASFVAVQGQQNEKSVSKIESKSELMKQLRDVKDLLDSGIIDKHDYDAQRSTIMNKLKA